MMDFLKIIFLGEHFFHTILVVLVIIGAFWNIKLLALTAIVMFKEFLFYFLICLGTGKVMFRPARAVFHGVFLNVHKNITGLRARLWALFFVLFFGWLLTVMINGFYINDFFFLGK